MIQNISISNKCCCFWAFDS